MVSTATKLVLIGFFFTLLAVPVEKSEARSAKDTLTYQVIWVTGNKSCYHNDNQRLQEFYDLTSMYLAEYGITAYSYKPDCMSTERYEKYQPPDYTDLLIVVYHQNVGREILHDNNMGGFFQWGNMENKNALRIEVCECAAFKYNDWAWVLSHELSHFALFYLGFSQDVYAGWVHAVQSRYYAYCPDGDIRDPNCDGLYTIINTPNRDYQMMAVYPYAYGADPPQEKFVNYVSKNQAPLKQKSRESYPALSNHQITILDEKISSAESSLKKLKSGLTTAQESIKKSAERYENNKSKDHIVKARNLYEKSYDDYLELKSRLTDLKDAFSDAKKSRTYYESEMYSILSSNFDDWNTKSRQIGSDLKYVSQELEYAKKANDSQPSKQQEKPCFLFWC